MLCILLKIYYNEFQWEKKNRVFKSPSRKVYLWKSAPRMRRWEESSYLYANKISDICTPVGQIADKNPHPWD